jgi:hypothetical protein
MFNFLSAPVGQHPDSLRSAVEKLTITMRLLPLSEKLRKLSQARSSYTTHGLGSTKKLSELTSPLLVAAFLPWDLLTFAYIMGSSQVIDRDMLHSASMEGSKENTANALQRHTAMASNNEREALSCGLEYELIRFD